METLVAYGSEIKTLEDKGDRLKIGGYLVLFGSPEEPDATRLRDYFTPSTDFDIPASGASSTVYYHHGLNPTLKARPLGKAYLTIDEAGVWMEAELRARDEYEAKIQELVRQGKLGLSSGTASHLVERTAVKNVYGEEVHRIDRWPLGLDASLTPAPGEPRTRAWCLKSLDEVAVGSWDELVLDSASAVALERAVLAEYVRVQAGLSGVRFELPVGAVEALKRASWDEGEHPRGESGPGTNAGSFTAAGSERRGGARGPSRSHDTSGSEEKPDDWIRPAGWHLPKNGSWSGTPGHSNFIPNDPESLGLKPDEVVPFRNGMPDFSKWAQEVHTVPGMNGQHKSDMPKIRKEIARKKGWVNSRGEGIEARAKKWLREQNLIPHHAGGDSVLLIPAKLHGGYGHQGVRHMGGAFGLRTSSGEIKWILVDGSRGW
jgi:phage head maturation protease